MRKLMTAGALAVGVFGLAADAEACPSYNESGATYYYTGADLYSARAFEVVAGGDYAIPICANVQPLTDRGPGYVARAPDFSFNLSGMEPYALVISAQGRCDTVLLINTGAVNWYYDDDDGQDARISLTRPSNGWLDVWVGTYGPENCGAILTLETFFR